MEIDAGRVPNYGPNNGWLRRDVEHLVYRCFDATGDLLYIGCTNSLVQRKCHHRRETPWWFEVINITTTSYPNRRAGFEAERAAIIAEWPRYNKQICPPAMQQYEGRLIETKR